MDDKLTPMEAEVLEMPRQKEEPRDFYGTAAPQATKQDHTAMWILLGLVIIAFCTGSVLLAILDVRLSKDAQGRWTVSVVTPAAVGEQTGDEPGSLTIPETDLILPGTAQQDGGKARVVIQSPNQDAPDDLALLYERVCRGVVCVEVQTYYGSSALTGVVLSRDGYILTASEGLSGALSITVTLPDGSQTSASRVGEDQTTGVALLSCQARDLTPAVFGGDDSLRVGDSVVTISNPYGSRMRNVMRDGVVSVLNREQVGGMELTLLASTAGPETVQPGCPVFNRFGQVVGITCPVGQSLSLDGSDPGFAVSATDLQAIVDRLSAGQSGSGVWLGLEVEQIPDAYQSYFQYPGRLWIGSVQPGSAAAEILYPWDVITKVDDTEVSTVEEFNAAVSAHRSGDQIKLTVYRAGRWYIATLPVVTD